VDGDSVAAAVVDCAGWAVVTSATTDSEWGDFGWAGDWGFCGRVVCCGTGVGVTFGLYRVEDTAVGERIEEKIGMGIVDV
jgi:hypothetical protein